MRIAEIAKAVVVLELTGQAFATLVDSEGSGTGTIKLTTYPEDGATETRLKVSVTGAVADSTLDVTIGDTVVGQVTSDASGNGRLILSSDPEGDEQKLPADFPTDIAAGTTVSVGSLSGAFAETYAEHGFHSRHFR